MENGKLILDACCGSIEIAVEDYTTAPFPTYLHRCNKCEHVIIESEWKEVKL